MRRLPNHPLETLLHLPERLFALAVNTLPDARAEVVYLPVNDRNGMPRHR